MVRVKKKYVIVSLIISVLVIIVSCIRIADINKNRHYYDTYRVNVEAGDTVKFGDLALTFGNVDSPAINKGSEFPVEEIAVYELPVKITKISNDLLDGKSKFGLYEKYKDYINLAPVEYTDIKGQGLMSILNQYKKNESIEIKISTDFVLGELYYYYDDYNVNKPAYIVIAGSPSSKGIPLYHYKLQQEA
ncbi:hypothetical protein [Terribacillus saccharophilus]|uniref:Uncharacterized protein n=1 Tax=Terribacillus saccharophilus TaxID=361277 RepID=A0A268A7P4_9BACI|nr:hypothetical protein [Terribacillus saccharophilus]PAD20152.1 hypothetical protein CHH64_15550 [Terribacillus saccharophilus]